MFLFKMNFENARKNMVDQQVRACDVLDENLLQVMAQTPRELFVPPRYREVAYADLQIPLNTEQAMLSPKEQGQLLQALALKKSDTILEIGTGCGYLTALLAQLGKYVYSVDLNPEFTQQAKTRLQQFGLHNFTCETGDASRGWSRHAPYDVIVVTGGLPTLPNKLADTLNSGGRVAAILGEGPAMRAMLLTLASDNTWRQRELFETTVTPIRHLTQKEKFIF